MAVTTTARFGLTQWGAGSDNPSRVAFNDALARIDANAAKDTGAAGGTALPTTGVVDGMYASTVDGIYRRHYRRAGGAWTQVGGNTWSETQYARGATGSAVAGVARQIGHADLANPSVREMFDGSSIRGARQAIGDLNTGAPGALHVGDVDSAVDLTTRGRVFARTAGSGGRGFVASAHATEAGPLFAAREPGGTDPWLVDAAGRMRSQAPTAFGAAPLTAGVPIASAPGTNDATAADFAAAADKAALRILRALGDANPIAQVRQDAITLGRSSWAGARIDLIAPTVSVTGPLSVSGAAGFGTVNAGQTTVTTLRATSDARALSLTADNGLNAEGGKVYSQTIGLGATLLSRPNVQYSGSSPASLRQSHVAYTVRNPNLGITSPESSYDMPIYMPEDGWMRLDTVLRVKAETGASNALETFRFNVTFELRQTDGTLIETGYTHVNSVTSDDTSRQINGYAGFTITDLFWQRITAGNYTIRLRHVRGTVLGGFIETIRYIATPVVLANVNQ